MPFPTIGALSSRSFIPAKPGTYGYVRKVLSTIYS